MKRRKVFIIILAVIASILFTIFIILLVRNNKLDEKYSILWIVFSIVIIIFALNRNILLSLSKFLGIHYAPATLFLVGFAFLIVFVIHLSMVITGNNKAIVRLTQKLAILEEKLKDK